MTIRYYDNPNLAHASHKRYKSLNVFSPKSTEEQKKVVFGDGSVAVVKTSSKNICNYVTIDDTRWHVMYYSYLNGGQVALTLQRDVIGEFGLDSVEANMFGKIDRGYTETILRNKKELSLNKILKRRYSLIPQQNNYGNVKIDTHDDELWGILYLVKPIGIDPNTGEAYQGSLSVNIPAFKPPIDVTLTYQESKNIVTNNILYYGVSFTFYLHFYTNKSKNNYLVQIRGITPQGFINNSTPLSYEVRVQYAPPVLSAPAIILTYNLNDVVNNDSIVRQIFEQMTIEQFYACFGSFAMPPVVQQDVAAVQNLRNYNGKNIEYNGKIYNYTTSYNEENFYGSNSTAKKAFEGVKAFLDDLHNKHNMFYFVSYDELYNDSAISACFVNVENYIRLQTFSLKSRILSDEEAGNIVIDLDKQLIDEPYYLLVCPLFNSTIDGETVNKSTNFNVFNSVIQYLSGTNAYLVDAQITSYCPDLHSVACSLAGTKFYDVLSNTFYRSINIDLQPYDDIKKDYIVRDYSIFAPDQSNRFDFNVYDYIKTNKNNLNILLKFSLKPYAIITAAVPTPETDTLINMSYTSDLRGCSPSSGGFEASISTNNFEQYKRNNSNYQQIFGKEMELLKKQQAVETTNNIAQGFMNVLSSTAFGAVAGASMADAGLLGSLVGSKSGGAALGAASFGGISFAANTAQIVANEFLQKYEKDYKQSMFDLNIGQIKNIPNTVSRISTFNELILKDFWYIVEVYECSDYEKDLVDLFLAKYGYKIDVYGNFKDFYRNGWFLKGTLITSGLQPNLHSIAATDLDGGVYYYEQS